MLPQEEWLHIAERLPVGGRTRVRHGHERRPNLVIGHADGHFWAYCQACRDGAKVLKEHVLFRAPAPAESTRLDPPRDLVPLSMLPEWDRDRVLRFLAGKGMDVSILPTIQYSASRARLYLLVQRGYGRGEGIVLLGRDITDKSPQKWLSHEPIPYMLAAMSPGFGGYSASAHSQQVPEHVNRLVLVEDAFSAFKVAAALRMHQQYAAVACLGTAVRPALALEIAQRNFEQVVLLFDGDDAGRRAAVDAHRQLRPFTRTITLQLTDGMDPKDLHQGELARIILGG